MQRGHGLDVQDPVTLEIWLQMDAEATTHTPASAFTLGGSISLMHQHVLEESVIHETCMGWGVLIQV